MIVGSRLGNANPSCGSPQRKCLIALRLQNLASGTDECVPKRSVMVVAGFLKGSPVAFLDPRCFRLNRHVCKHNCCEAERPANIDTVNICVRVVLTALTLVQKQVCMKTLAADRLSSHRRSRLRLCCAG